MPGRCSAGFLLDAGVDAGCSGLGVRWKPQRTPPACSHPRVRCQRLADTDAGPRRTLVLAQRSRQECPEVEGSGAGPKP